jgi:hypothetical protein
MNYPMFSFLRDLRLNCKIGLMNPVFLEILWILLAKLFAKFCFLEKSSDTGQNCLMNIQLAFLRDLCEPRDQKTCLVMVLSISMSKTTTTIVFIITRVGTVT